ncbi:hypothetical protein MRY87_12270 [bacterium]|nr:hypothetical protein [bacterium]
MKNGDDGFALITVYLLLASLLAMLGAYFTITTIELATTKHSKDSATGFYSAEAGLNIRAQQVRSIFLGYNRPSGTEVDTAQPVCEGGNIGSGDFACTTYTFNGRDVTTYVTEDADNPYNQPVPAGDRYEGLDMQEYRYTVISEARNAMGDTEAILELRFKSRLVPMFQFVAFYDKDLEINNGPNMTLSGPVHTNGDFYSDPNNGPLTVNGDITIAGRMFQGKKQESNCNGGTTRVQEKLSGTVSAFPTCGSRYERFAADVEDWEGAVEIGAPVVEVPAAEEFEATPGSLYFDSADLRLALLVDASRNPLTTNSPTGVEVRDASDNLMVDATNELHNCAGSVSGRPVGTTGSFTNNREGYAIRMLEVDMRAILNCIRSVNVAGSAGAILGGRALDDDTDGGLVMHLTVDGPASLNMDNRYGVRIRNAAELQSNIAGAPAVRGITLVTPQAIYTAGHYNSVGKIPAALLADSYNPLSVNWNDTNSAGNLWQDGDNNNLTNRKAETTIVNAAILSGTDSTGGAEGVGGQDSSNYNGGLENYPRFHENWTGKTFQYRGSFVSLNVPTRVNGAWFYGSNRYTAPQRDWDYDTDFNDASNLPPLTPRFVYLRQELFVRDFEQ